MLLYFRILLFTFSLSPLGNRHHSVTVTSALLGSALLGPQAGEEILQRLPLRDHVNAYRQLHVGSTSADSRILFLRTAEAYATNDEHDKRASDHYRHRIFAEGVRQISIRVDGHLGAVGHVSTWP